MRQLEQRFSHGVRLVPNSRVIWSRSSRVPGRETTGQDAVPQFAWPPGSAPSRSIRLISDISDTTFSLFDGSPKRGWPHGVDRKGCGMAKRRCPWSGSCRRATPPSTPVRGVTPPPSTGSSQAGYYAKLGRTLEEGCFDMMFFDDRLAMPGIYGGSVAEAVRLGARPVKLDLSVVLGVIAGATDRSGWVPPTPPPTTPPFHVARTFATLDHLSGGRAAWNVVTSVNDSEAQNYGFDRASRPRRTLRPRRRVPRGHRRTVGHLGGRRPGARPVGGVFADPDKVHELGHEGRWFTVRGPLTVPRSPQGRPVLLQAGSSGRGRDFAARWAELIFTGDPDIEVARNHYKDQKERIGAGGSRPRVGQDAAHGVHGAGGVDGARRRSGSRCSCTTWSTRWPR